MTRFPIPIALAVVLVAAAAGPPPDPPAVTLYDPDPGHAWNRVHAALFVRTGPDGVDYGRDRLEPLLWSDSDHLLRGPQADRAAAALDAFVRATAEARVDDPVKRAVFQRDLWLVANWLAGGTEAAERTALLDRVAAVVRRVALTPEQVAGLPDNYAAAVAATAFAERFDPDKPERAYLPADLFDPAGPWVCVGRTDGPTAPNHLDAGGGPARPGHPFTNSTFLVFLKLPAGRAAGLAYVAELARHTKPMLLPGVVGGDGRPGPARPNPDLPRWPKGTELALVRRAMLVDTGGRVVASPLTESVQLRVSRAVPAGVPSEDELAHFARNPPPRNAAVFEFQFGRAALFAKAAGGLRDVSAEGDFATGFAGHHDDPFRDEKPPFLRLGPWPGGFAQPVPTRRLCAGCHGGSAAVDGTFSFQRGGTADETPDAASPPMYPIAATDVATVERAAVAWKEGRPGWAAVRKRLTK